MKDAVSLEIIIISFVMVSAILSCQWMISTPEEDSEGTFKRTNRYVSLAFGFIICAAILIALASQNVGFGFIMIFLTGILYSELVRNTLDIDSKVKFSSSERRIFVMSNMIGIFSVLFSIILSLMYILERINA